MHSSAGNLKKGQFVLHNEQVWQVIKTDFNYRGRGSATVKAKIRNVIFCTVIENTTKSDALYEIPEVDSIQTQYLYKTTSQAFFMDPRSYEQHQIDIGLT